MEIMGRVPPHNLEAEQSVLGAMILDKDAIVDASEIISSDEFYKEAHREIFSAIITLFNRNEPVDLVTLSHELEIKGVLDSLGGMAYLSDLTTAGIITTNAKYYAKIISEKAILRRLIHASSDIIEKGYGSEEPDVLLDIAEQHIFEISQNKSKDGFSRIDSILMTTFDNIEKLYHDKGATTGLSTGFADLDQKHQACKNQT